MSKEAMKLALEALENAQANFGEWWPEAIAALREALASEAKEQPAPVQGWKLVPIEPTEDMWKAVNKLDDEMAAGSYDGKGCSIEQAWNCLLAAAPQPAPATELREQEPVAWGVDWGRAGDQSCVSIIKRLPDGGIEVLATEYGPPASKPWVGLTDEQWQSIADTLGCIITRGQKDAIEAKLREKNQ